MIWLAVDPLSADLFKNTDRLIPWCFLDSSVSSSCCDLVELEVESIFKHTDILTLIVFSFLSFFETVAIFGTNMLRDGLLCIYKSVVSGKDQSRHFYVLWQNGNTHSVLGPPICLPISTLCAYFNHSYLELTFFSSASFYVIFLISLKWKWTGPKL